jgi:hypothetical protein
LDPTDTIVSISKIIDNVLNYNSKDDIQKVGERAESEVLIGKENIDNGIK